MSVTSVDDSSGSDSSGDGGGVTSATSAARAPVVNCTFILLGH